MGKLIAKFTIGGVSAPRVITTFPNANVGDFVRTVPGVGEPFYYWETGPEPLIDLDYDTPPFVDGVDWSMAMTVSSDIDENNSNIEDFLALGLDHNDYVKYP